jgi:hypothetical protein
MQGAAGSPRTDPPGLEGRGGQRRGAGGGSHGSDGRRREPRPCRVVSTAVGHTRF